MRNSIAIALAVATSACYLPDPPPRHEYCAEALAEASDWRQVHDRDCFPDDWRFCWNYECEGGPNAVAVCLQAWVPAGFCEDFEFNGRQMHVCTPGEYPCLI